MLEGRTAIIGYSGHAFVVAESHLTNGNSLEYYTGPIKLDRNPYNLVYLGCESDPNFKGWEMGLGYILGIGDNELRYRVAQLLLTRSQSIKSVLDLNSTISKSANIGRGVYASKGVQVNAFSKIGDFVILNTGCIIEHECEIGEASHVAPGAVLAGNVRIGKRSFIGANSVIKQGVEIGDDVTIGAGAVIIRNIPSKMKVAGNPGRILL